MNNFELCYRVRGKEPETFIVPQLPPTQQPTFTWNDGEIFRFQYPFQPKGILARLIVRLNALIARDEDDQDIVWKKGVMPAYEKPQADCRSDEKIDIKVTMGDVRDLLGGLKRELKKLAEPEAVEALASHVAELKTLKDIEDPDELQEEGGTYQLKELINDLADEESVLGRAVKRTKKGWDICRQLAEKADGILKTCGMAGLAEQAAKFLT